jgi:hypothetical protein
MWIIPQVQFETSILVFFFAKNDGGSQDWPPLTFSLWVVTNSYFLESFWVAMMMVSLPISTTQNPYSIFFKIWNVSSNVVWLLWLMIGWGSTTSLHLFVLFRYVQLHQLSFHANIIVFLCRLCQLHVHDAWCITLWAIPTQPCAVVSIFKSYIRVIGMG